MKHYLIKKGNHYCSMSFFEKLGGLGWKVKKYSVRFILHSSCWWAPARNTDDGDLNKLTGICYGLNVHGNSVRLTWVPDFTANGKIDIHGYTYDKNATGTHNSLYITSVQVGQTYDGCIEVQGNKYKITVNGVSIMMDNTHKDPSLCNRLYPYFGGNNTAPQDMTIDIEYL